jgi:hypothetical protein
MNVELCSGLVEPGAGRGDDNVKRVPNAKGIQGPFQKRVKDRTGDDADGNPGPVNLPHGGNGAWNRRCPGQRPAHEIRDTAPHVVFRHLKAHGGKDLFETSLGGQLVPMLDDLVAQLPVAGIRLVEYGGGDLPAVSI